MLALSRLVKQGDIKDIRAFDFYNPFIQSCTIEELTQAIKPPEKERGDEIAGPKGTNLIIMANDDRAQWTPSFNDPIRMNQNTVYVFTLTSFIKCIRAYIHTEPGLEIIIARNMALQEKWIAIKSDMLLGYRTKIGRLPINDTMCHYNRYSPAMIGFMREKAGWVESKPEEEALYKKWKNTT